jgi:hypothetical protein
MAHTPHFPLAEIVETQTYPHARTLRTSFVQKLQDTFYAIAGKLPILARKPHVGIFDYLTLYIPTGLLFLMEWCLEKARGNFLATVLLTPVVLINISLLIARVAFSVVATILFSPITAIVHGISRLVAGQSHAEALSLVGQLKDGGEQILSDYLTQHHMDIEELNVTIKKSPQQIESTSTEKEAGSSYQLMFWRKATGPSEGLVCGGCLNGSCNDNHAPFSVEISQENGTNVTKQATYIHALFKLNVGDVVSNIEEANITDKRTILAI